MASKSSSSDVRAPNYSSEPLCWQPAKVSHFCWLPTYALKYNPISPQEWLCDALRTGITSSPQGFSGLLKNWLGFRDLVPAIAEGWILWLQADSPKSTPSQCGPKGRVAK